MFEDSTFESTGRISTRSRGWMIATFTLNSFILMALIVIPLIYPQALPRMASAFLMMAPPAPAPESKPQVRPERVVPAKTEIQDGRIQAPSVIPPGIKWVDKPEALPSIDVAGMDTYGGLGRDNNLFGGETVRPVVRAAKQAPVRVSSMVVEGLLLRKDIPVYPAIAKATGTQGRVVLQATISKNGTIENLRVVSGPTLLQQAALDAVRSWRYRPYLLNGQPVDVETTVNVDFKLQ